MLRLVINDSSGERTFASERSEIVLGRRDDVDLQIGDPAASRSHCMLRVEGDRVKLVDLGTVNGTHFDGVKVDHATLGPGDEFRIGKTTLRIVAFSTPVLATPPGPTRAKPALALEADPKPGLAAPVLTGAGPSDFSRELRAMIGRAPWYLVSLVVHIIALMVLDLVTFSKADHAIHSNLKATLPDRMAALDEADDKIEDDDLELDEPDQEIVIPDDMPEPPAKAPPPPEVDREPVIGSAGPRKNVKLKVALPTKAKFGKDVTAKVDRGNLEAEHESAAGIVKKGLSRGGRGIPKGIPADRILIVEGEFDKMENVLDTYGIKYTLVQRRALLRRKFPRAKLLCINCARPVRSVERKKLVATIKSFVQRGGWLITSDWALEPYLTMGFPDRVRRKDSKRQPDTVVTVRPTKTSPILEGAFGRRTRTDWWLEETSTMFDVTPGKVNVLVVSEDMEKRYGSKVVVFDFLSGQGRVLHLLGHFYQKDGNRMGIVGMHRLILNYVSERFPSNARRPR